MIFVISGVDARLAVERAQIVVAVSMSFDEQRMLSDTSLWSLLLSHTVPHHLHHFAVMEDCTDTATDSLLEYWFSIGILCATFKVETTRTS